MYFSTEANSCGFFPVLYITYDNSFIVASLMVQMASWMSYVRLW